VLDGQCNNGRARDHPFIQCIGGLIIEEAARLVLNEADNCAMLCWQIWQI